MRQRFDPPDWDFEDAQEDPYDHLMDDVDAMLEEDAYHGPRAQQYYAQPRYPQQPYEQPGYSQPRSEQQWYDQEPRRQAQPSYYAYNADFQARDTHRKQQKRPRGPQNQAQAHAGRQPRETVPKAPKPRRKKRHPILKLLLCLLVLVVLAAGALWIFAKQPMTDAPIGARKDGCATILLAGTDKDGTRTDTMILMYLDSNKGEVNLMSLPRDTYTYADLSVPKLNGIYGVNGGGKDGMEALMDYVSDFVGYRPDGYILVDLDCFEKLVDIMGGVTFNVPMDMQYEDPAQDLYINLQAGEQKLNGEEAMWVVRYRSGYALADLQRVQVQRDFLKAAVDQWTSPGKFFRSPAASVLLASNTTTDLSLRNLVWVGKVALGARNNGMTMETLPGEAAMISGGSYYVTWPETTAALVNASFNPYEVAITKENIYSPWY